MSKVAILLVGSLFVAVPSLAAPSTAATCSGRKLKAAAGVARTYTRCSVDAVAKHNGFVSPTCTSDALDPLADRFARIEASGGCATIDDRADIRSIVEFAINDVGAFIDHAKDARRLHGAADIAALPDFPGYG